MKTDSLFYRLFQHLPSLVLELAGITVTNSDGYQFRSEEIKQTAFRMDGVLVPPAASTQLPLVFVEVQYQPDVDLYGRFFAEIMLYLYRVRPPNPWQAVAIYPNRRCEHIDNWLHGSLLGLPEVRRVYLDDLAGKPAASPGLALVQLITTDTASLGEKAAHLVRQIPRLSGSLKEADLLDLVETILVYRLPRLSREEIKAMFGLDTELKQTRFYQEVFAEGRQQESITLVLKQLKRRFGTLEAAQTDRIQTLALPQIEALAEALLDFQDVADLERWLADR